MTADTLVTFLVGALCIAWSGAIGLHEILLQPEQVNYPNARARLRVLMFAAAVALLHRGAEILANLHSPDPQYVTVGSLVATGLLATCQFMLLEQALRSWLPARIQKRVQQLLHVASCHRRREVHEARKASMAAVRAPVEAPPNADCVGAALAELTLQGVNVVGPNEPPSALDPLWPGR